MDYQRDLDKLTNNFAIIKNSYLDSMAEHLWSYDTRLLDIQLDGLSRLEGVSYLKLTADQKVIYESGKADPTEENHKKFEILHKNTNEILGSLDVELDIKSLQEKYLSEAVWIFIRQAAKTAVVVFFLYFIFNRILVVHIQHIARFLRSSPTNDSQVIQLRRRQHSDKDELDTLVDSLNDFRKETLLANAQLEQLNQALENKVADRTRELTVKNQTLQNAMEQIKRMQATMIGQEKLASLGRLTSNVAHEIRNPLNFVLNFSELLNEAEDQDEIKEVSRVILKHSHRIDQIVRSMQILAGEASDTLESSDVNEIIKAAYQQTVSARILSSSYIPPKVTYRMAESARAQVYTASLMRAISNILDNAIYALEKKVHQKADFEPELTISTSMKSDSVEISIRDNGIGIPRLLGETVFEPFLTTKTPGEGSGLGLTVAFNIAQKHGGTLKYSSDQGEWTEFTMTLPLVQEKVNA
jgi:Signal transduction histidine kinase regulating C4-dicarboxylate transport system